MRRIRPWKPGSFRHQLIEDAGLIGPEDGHQRLHQPTEREVVRLPALEDRALQIGRQERQPHKASQVRGARRCIEHRPSGTIPPDHPMRRPQGLDQHRIRSGLWFRPTEDPCPTTSQPHANRQCQTKPRRIDGISLDPLPFGAAASDSGEKTGRHQKLQCVLVDLDPYEAIEGIGHLRRRHAADDSG